MIPPLAFHIFCLIWFFGGAFFLLKFPEQTYKLMSWGKKPENRDLKIAKFVGYMGIFFGSLTLVNVIAEIIRSVKI